MMHQTTQKPASRPSKRFITNKKKIKQDTMSRSQLRNLLNSLFLIGFLVALILYISIPEDRRAFLAVCFISMAIKVAEYIVRYFR